MTIDLETLQNQIPYYLANADRAALVRELKAIAEGATGGYILDDDDDSFRAEMLQGDGWRNLPIYVFDTGERKPVFGMILSNSCDIDPKNSRALPPQIVFAPLIRTSKFEARLASAGASSERIEQIVGAIRAQLTTAMFYLPAGGPLKEDHIVALDDVHSMPFAPDESIVRQKVFTLSMAGFYMLAFKLSVHFCRLHEEVNRFPRGGAAPAV